MLLSVIIPVYRVEHTLQRCVESVLSQGVDDMEVILVDDGSPDNCPVLCDGWAEKDARVKVIHKDNGGLSDARNAGIEMATGDYLTFVDSDDYVEDDTYPALLQIMAEHPDYDLLEYPIVNRLSLEDRTYQQTQEYWLDTKAYLHTYAWNKIYRRHLFDDIRFPVGRIFEDVYTFPQLLRVATTIATTQMGATTIAPTLRVLQHRLMVPPCRCCWMPICKTECRWTTSIIYISPISSRTYGNALGNQSAWLQDKLT